jgi:hypothetical protein
VQTLCGKFAAGIRAARWSRRPINREGQNMFRNLKSWSVVVLVVLILGMNLSSARAGDREDIVGRWNFSQDEQQYFRFQADGTFKLVSPLRTFEGNYRVLDDGYLELDYPGLIYGRTKEELKYKLSKDTLEFKFGETVGKYQRAK